jgi:hypothetical protein
MCLHTLVHDNELATHSLDIIPYIAFEGFNVQTILVECVQGNFLAREAFLPLSPSFCEGTDCGNFRSFSINVEGSGKFAEEISCDISDDI